MLELRAGDAIATVDPEGGGRPLGRRHLELTIGATNCDHVVVFTEPDDATCVEPQTGPPDGLRTGDAAIVTPEEPLLASTHWAWTVS